MLVIVDHGVQTKMKLFFGHNFTSKTVGKWPFGEPLVHYTKAVGQGSAHQTWLGLYEQP